jgi:hypothetical protein
MKGVKVTVISCQECGIEVIANNPMRKRCEPCADKVRRANNAARLPAWQVKNRDKCIDYTKAYTERHPERYRQTVKETSKRQREKMKNDPPEKVKARKDYHANYFQSNSAALKARNSQWRKDHPEQAKALGNRQNHTRRAREAQAGGTWSFKDFMELCQASDGRCYDCQEKCDKLTADHMTPLARGGSNWIENIVPVCGTCNSSKGTKTVLEHHFPLWRELTC